MKQPEDTRTGDLFRSANARRQAAFKARWIEAGWKRKTLWVNEADFVLGMKAAQAKRGSAPSGVDRRSWFLGFAEGLECSSSAAGRVSSLRAAGATVREPTKVSVVGRKASRARSEDVS